MAKKKETQKDFNKSLSVDLLDSYRKALYKIKEFFDGVGDLKFDDDNISETMKIVTNVLSAGEKLGKNIETLAILEKKVLSEEQDKTKRRGTESTSMFEE